MVLAAAAFVFFLSSRIFYLVHTDKKHIVLLNQKLKTRVLNMQTKSSNLVWTAGKWRRFPWSHFPHIHQIIFLQKILENAIQHFLFWMVRNWILIWVLNSYSTYTWRVAVLRTNALYFKRHYYCCINHFYLKLMIPFLWYDEFMKSKKYHYYYHASP